MAQTTVLYTQPEGNGWGPITMLAHLTARLCEAELLTVPDVPLSRIEKLSLLAPRLPGRDTLIVIASIPEHLNMIARVPGLHRRFARIIGWVVDCWWTDRIPVSVTRGRLFDELFVTERGVVEDWQQAAHCPVSWLPLGTDVLAALERSQNIARSVDIQRVGRVSPAWDDDSTTARLCQQAGLTYGPRPPFGENPEESYDNVCRAYAQARIVLAFSNRVSPARYTHPTRDYVTNRWLDALAHGALVAGTRPISEGTDDLLWEGATVEVDPHDVEGGIEFLAGIIPGQSNEQVRERQREALMHLEWRDRVEILARAARVRPETLVRELHQLREMRHHLDCQA